MQIIYLFSKKSIEYNFVDNVINYLKRDIKEKSIITFIGGWEGNYEHTLNKSNEIIRNLKLIGFEFYKVNIISENTSFMKAKNMIDEADVLYLQGGVPHFQYDFINKKQIRNNIINFDGVIFGESAGAMNLSCKVLEIPMSKYINIENIYDGFNLIPFSVIPHFNIKTFNDEIIDMWETDKALMSDFKKAAVNNGDIYCIPDESVIRYCNKNIKVLNSDCYLYIDNKFIVIECEK